MLDDRHRRILRQMNVDVWVLRAAPGQGRAGRAPDVAVEAQPAAAAAALRAALDRTSTPPTVAGRPAAAPAAAPAPTPAPAPLPDIPGAVSDAAGGQPFEVVSVALPGVVLLLDGAVSRRDMRLARDLVSAVAGDWNRQPERRRFVWPPTSGVLPGSAGDAHPDRAGSAASRALRAFADKHLEDHRARLLICAGQVGERLADDWDGVRLLRIAALSQLGRDAAAKRRLWAELARVP